MGWTPGGPSDEQTLRWWFSTGVVVYQNQFRCGEGGPCCLPTDLEHLLKHVLLTLSLNYKSLF